MSVHTWHQASLAVSRHLRRKGYVDAVPVPGGPESGVDVRATHALALVRTDEAPVRREHLQRLVTARGQDKHVALFAATTGRFELPALTFADSNRILLLTFDAAGEVAPYDHNAALLGSGSAAGMLPAATAAMLRFAPLGFAAFFLIATAIQAVGLVRGASGASWGGLAISLGSALLFGVGWLAARRRRTRAAATRGRTRGRP